MGLITNTNLYQHITSHYKPTINVYSLSVYTHYQCILTISVYSLSVYTHYQCILTINVSLSVCTHYSPPLSSPPGHAVADVPPQHQLRPSLGPLSTVQHQPKPAINDLSPAEAIQGFSVTMVEHQQYSITYSYIIVALLLIIVH